MAKPESSRRRAADIREPICKVTLCNPALAVTTFRAVGLTVRCNPLVAASGPHHVAVPAADGCMLSHPTAVAESSDGDNEGDEELPAPTPESTACGQPRTDTSASSVRPVRQTVASAPLPMP